MPYATFAYNITVHSSTNFSPSHLVYGRDVTLPDAITRKKPIYNYDNYADLLIRELHDAWYLAKENLQQAKTKNKQYYDKRVHNPLLKVDDMVFISNEVKKHKFDTPNLGPFRVTAIPSDQYIEIDYNGKTKKIHRNRTKKAKANHADISQQNQKIINIIRTFY